MGLHDFVLTFIKLRLKFVNKKSLFRFFWCPETEKDDFSNGIVKLFDHCVQEDAGIKKETMKQFYVVNDMYDFDNIGFTKSVDNNTIKYLICADCEVGPLGWHCISSKKNFVALARVKHV